MATKKTGVLVGIAAIAVIGGLIARQDGLSLLGVFMLVVSGIARLWNRYVLRKVSYQRTLKPRRAFIGETVELTRTFVVDQSAKTYDLEAWAAGQERWLEVSSVSACEDYQTRRGGIRVKGRDGKTFFPHALNGSALALPRVFVAILENNQQADGTVVVPEVLRPYMGGLEKIEVRRLAREARLPTHQKRDSTGICFIGERKFKDFLGRYLPARPGDIVTLDGEVIGRHQGLMFHTIGQRRGLGLSGGPWYVVGKDLQTNVLTVAQGHDNPLLYRDNLNASQVFWVHLPPLSPARLMARCRHRQPLQRCTVLLQDDRLSVRFDAPQRAITPGQSVVQP